MNIHGSPRLRGGGTLPCTSVCKALGSEWVRGTQRVVIKSKIRAVKTSLTQLQRPLLHLSSARGAL